MPQTPYDRAVAAIRSGGAPEEEARALLGLLTETEKLGLLDGDEPFWPGMPEMMGIGYNLEPIVAGAVPRLGVPGIRFSDGPRGAVIGQSTAFPVPMARGATWDPGLEERVGEAIGAEIRAQGGNFFGGVCINLLRHPAWGRAQETYGEEPLLLGAMGVALARGAQRHVMACVKHYALQQHGERPVQRRRPGATTRRCTRSTCRTSATVVEAGRRERDERLQLGERRVVRAEPRRC